MAVQRQQPSQKIFKYRGKTLEELQELSFEEFAELLPSELRRKLLKRGLTEEEKKLLAKVEAQEKNIRTHCRELPVTPNMVGLRINVYNGKDFAPVTVVSEMIGLRLGELAPTRKIGVSHAGQGAKRKEVRK